MTGFFENYAVLPFVVFFKYFFSNTSHRAFHVFFMRIAILCEEERTNLKRNIFITYFLIVLHYPFAYYEFSIHNTQTCANVNGSGFFAKYIGYFVWPPFAIISCFKDLYRDRETKTCISPHIFFSNKRKFFFNFCDGADPVSFLSAV